MLRDIDLLENDIRYKLIKIEKINKNFNLIKNESMY